MVDGVDSNHQRQHYDAGAINILLIHNQSLTALHFGLYASLNGTA